MSSIIVLDENTSNKIAAGEVIERPASIVKELVENSIDAGATSISVDIKKGGISYIKVTDNGSGMAADDVLIAFERHATSKIRQADDLFNITTMGFRGEALASIAAISNVELITRTKDSEVGTYVLISGGRLIEEKGIGCPVGTTFIVKDLFFNTPARYKFLKKDTTEASYIDEMLSRIALSRTDISFRLTGAYAKKNEVFHTPGNNDLRSAVYNIFGREIANKLISVEFEEEDLKISGLIGPPDLSKANRNMQMVFLNSRYIKNKIISAAAGEAYMTYLMKHKFPVLFLNIEMNPTNFDVNVHPAKLEVRFSNERKLFSGVYHAIVSSLQKKTEIQEPLKTVEEDIREQEPVEATTVETRIETRSEPILETRRDTPEEFTPAPVVENTPKTTSYEQQILTNSYVAAERESDVHPLKDVEDSVFIGQLFNTFILLQGNEKVYLVDQHAAHERIIYEELLKLYEENDISTQVLLVPEIVELTPGDFAVYSENEDIYERLGFVIDPFGASALAIRGIPAQLEGGYIQEAFFELISKLSTSNRDSSLPDGDIVYSVACKTAIKANHRLDNKDVCVLLERLSKTKNPLSCPHGRPTVLNVSRRDFEKLFKRIV